MADQWIVRVQGKEYGPVDLDELRDWRREGRLIRDNELREPESEHWFRAGTLPEIFSEEASAEAEPPPLVRRLSLGEIFAGGWRIYTAGFARFFILALLVSVPSFFLQMAAPYLEMPKNQEPIGPVVIGAAIVVFVTLVMLVIAWPFSLGATQLLAADLHAGRSHGIGELLTRAKPLWTRMFTLGLIVYASYLLWTILPSLVAFSLVAGAPSGSGIFLALALLIFAAYMVARLFINFLFWQQAGALSQTPAFEALQVSKELARSGRELPWTERPLYRGALIASLWILIIIVLNLAIELPAVLYKMRGVTTVEQAATMIQTMATKNSPDFVSIVTTLLSCLVHAVLRPWLAAVFIVLYLNTKANFSPPK
ncbi:MAG: DUF4339 domain-containing protein [Verrucomicrobiota bacterium]|nr:DUF4339 domain-containing protein [Verrucomicrobiota bacterium]